MSLLRLTVTEPGRIRARWLRRPYPLLQRHRSSISLGRPRTCLPPSLCRTSYRSYRLVRPPFCASSAMEWRALGMSTNGIVCMAEM